MVASTYDTAMTMGVFPHEGGYTNDPRDPGGPTNWGITLADARLHWKPYATAQDVRDMPKAVAEVIYARHYADPLRYNDLPAGVDYAVLDYGINSGVARAARVLAALVGCNDRVSSVNSTVVALVKQRDPSQLIKAIDDERLRFLESLPTWNHFGPGWGRRVREVNALALEMASGKTPLPLVTKTVSGETMAKGKHPEPQSAKHVVTGGIVGAISGASVTAHTYGAPVAIAFVAGAVVATLVVLHFVYANHDDKQIAPMPSTVPVPVAPTPTVTVNPPKPAAAPTPAKS